jgi:DNA polymerase I-like protein with 3'-5' exonuclease and polymerase domains
MRGKLVHTVHDSSLTEVPVAEVDRTKPLVVRAFETPIKGVKSRMKVDVNVVKRWGEDHESRLAVVFQSVGVQFKE